MAHTLWLARWFQASPKSRSAEWYMDTNLYAVIPHRTGILISTAIIPHVSDCWLHFTNHAIWPGVEFQFFIAVTASEGELKILINLWSDARTFSTAESHSKQKGKLLRSKYSLWTGVRKETTGKRMRDKERRNPKTITATPLDHSTLLIPLGHTTERTHTKAKGSDRQLQGLSVSRYRRYTLSTRHTADFPFYVCSLQDTNTSQAGRKEMLVSYWLVLGC